MAEQKEKEDSFRKGAKFAIGVIVVIILFFITFEPKIVVGPVDLPNEKIIDSSVPLKENSNYSNPKISSGKCPTSCGDSNICTEDICSYSTDFKCVHQKLDPCCGDGICNEGEYQNSCSSDCKGSLIKVNNYELKEEIGKIPENLKSLDEGILKTLKPIHVSTAAEGKAFLILDLTINNSNSNSFFLNVWDMTLKDEGGYVYQYSPATNRFDTVFGNTELDKDEIISGIIVFEVPNNKKNFVFKIEASTSYSSVPIVLT